MSMPRILLLVRHAKSSWEDDSLADRDRPLNKRGMVDAPEMADRLRQRLLIPDRIVSSPAVRAYDTACSFSQTLDLPVSQIQVEEELYAATSGEILEVVRSLDDSVSVALVVTHNPGLTDLVNEMTSQVIENVPTCGVVTLELPSWSKATHGRMVDFDYPKRADTALP